MVITPKKELTFNEWAAKRHTQDEDGFGLDRLCQVGHRVSALPCGCKREQGKELFVGQRGKVFICGMRQTHDDRRQIYCHETDRPKGKKIGNPRRRSRF